MAAPKPRVKPKSETVLTETDMVFTAYNYKLILVGVALVVIGFIAMAVEGKWDGFVSLYVSPILIVAGFAELAWAIMAKEPEKKN